MDELLTLTTTSSLLADAVEESTPISC
jgi:hypothetical protein